MSGSRAFLAALLCFLALLIAGTVAQAQTGNEASVSGAVADPTGAVVANASVNIHNAVSGYDRTVTTDNMGNFTFPNVPFKPYVVTVTASGFAPHAENIDVRSNVPLTLMKINLQLAGAQSTVTVESAGALVETDSTAHTDIDRQLFQDVPLESASSSLSSLVTLASPGVAADSNGLFHGLGDHAQNSFSVDGQPITDQQSKVFSNQLPVDAVQSMEVALPAEYGDKTSLFIDVTTRSGQGITTPHGSFTADYGTFGTTNGAFDLAYGGQKWGNFIAASGVNTSRFLDPPEFVVMHDKGNEENLFDRIDYQFSKPGTYHVSYRDHCKWAGYMLERSVLWLIDGNREPFGYRRLFYRRGGYRCSSCYAFRSEGGRCGSGGQFIGPGASLALARPGHTQAAIIRGRDVDYQALTQDHLRYIPWKIWKSERDSRSAASPEGDRRQ